MKTEITTKKFREVFYIPSEKDGSHIDDLIGGYTLFLNRIGSLAHLDFERLKVLKKLYCSHVELWLPNDEGFFEVGRWYRKIDEKKLDKICFAGQSWSSTMGQVGGKGRTGSGIRVAPACEIYKNPNRWFYTEFEVSEKRYEDLKTYLQFSLENNAGYDKKLILNFFIPKQIWNFDSKYQYICNEFCNSHLLTAITDNHDIASIKVLSKLDENFSPILTATILHYCGKSFYNMDGSLLLAGDYQTFSA